MASPRIKLDLTQVSKGSEQVSKGSYLPKRKLYLSGTTRWVFFSCSEETNTTTEVWCALHDTQYIDLGHAKSGAPVARLGEPRIRLNFDLSFVTLRPDVFCVLFGLLF